MTGNQPAQMRGLTSHSSAYSSIHTLDISQNSSEKTRDTHQDGVLKYQPFAPSFQLFLCRLFRRSNILTCSSAAL
jgi:hypothetical protein